MDDMNNLKEFIDNKVSFHGNQEGCGMYIENFYVDELKELRYLASLALVEALCAEHGEIMKDVLKDVEK